MHLAPLIRDLAVILGVAGLVSLLFQKIRQPLILGYIVAGIIVGPHTLPYPLVRDIPSIQTWAEIGVIFLMFSLGLEFSFRKLARVGFSAGLTAFVEVSIMLAAGFGLGKLLGWKSMDSLFLGAMLAIASTSIILKTLTDLGLTTRRFAEFIFALLIVEDLVAILILVSLSSVALGGGIAWLPMLQSGAKLVLVIGTWFLAGYFALPRLVRYVGRSTQPGADEVLGIVSVGLCLLLVVLAAHLGYSLALGAFIMGSILAESTESHRIQDLLTPLRDLFAAIFFVSVGMLFEPAVLRAHAFEVAIITICFLAAKITSTTLAALLTGQTLRTSVQVGFGVAQIGEFSFILAGLGKALGVTSDFLYPVAVTVSAFTAFTTPYLVRVSHRAAVALEGRLPVRLREGLDRYVVWMRDQRTQGARTDAFRRALFRWFLNGLVVTAVFVSCSELFLPYLRGRMTAASWFAVLGWVLAAVFSSPFIWAMFFSFRGYRFFLLSRALTVIWLGALSVGFFPARYVAFITAVLVAGILALLYRQAERAYRWFEATFVSTFDAAEKSRPRADLLRSLAPWDAHLVRLKVHPNAEVVLKTMAETQLRSRWGVSVVAIQRGLKTLVAPRPTELILPKDELLVLGTDEQIEKVRPDIETPPGLAGRFKDISGYELRELVVEPGSSLEGRTIRELRLGERFGAMVVGIERADHRKVINPESNQPLVAGEILWIVGESEGLPSPAVLNSQDFSGATQEDRRG